jgi:Cft2 family RNA processing exonuclease
MKLHFLGGANEVGASCTLLEIEGQRVLIDAGIRMGAPQGSHLPNFSVLDDVGRPDEVLITHAHTDHTGALPVLASALDAGTRLLCTPATKAITRVLLSDAVKIMSIKEEGEGELPLYPPEAADAVLARMQDVPWLTTVPICDGNLKATWIPSGHILGAASIYIEGKNESVLMSGDVSVANQRTIPGMTVPHCQPDVIVLESTYGNRQHADREQQERALVDKVAAVIERKGKVLIPAFAVGRSQEVILILAKAMREKVIPPFPVFVDGMVRSVNAVYAEFGEELANPVRKRVARGEDPFYNEWIGAISVPADRERVLAGPPCCIVASSGMLIGGASSFYAERLVSDPKNLIAITGYQDEESPGRALLDLTRKTAPEDRVLMINGERKTVSCAVESYSLSAHADGGELAALVRCLGPRAVCLVHGDPDARGALAESLDPLLRDGVHMPDNGGTFSLEPGESRKPTRYGRSIPRGGIGGGDAPESSSLTVIHDYLQETGSRGPLRIQEISEVWFGNEGADVDRVEAFRKLLKDNHDAFRPDFRRPYLFHLNTSEPSGADGRMEMNAARDRIVSALPEAAGLIRCSAHVDDGVYELAVHFPDVTRVRFAEALAQLETETGWSLKVRDTPHQARLFEEAIDCLPESAEMVKAPALRVERKEVLVIVSVPADARPEWKKVETKACALFTERTGYSLILSDAANPQKPVESSTPKGALEINKAYGVIAEAFSGEPHAPYRVGMKPDPEGAYVDATFISPMVGARYQEKLDALSKETGWAIRVRQSANQEQIAMEARRITPKTCQTRGAAKFYPTELRVVVPVQKLPRSVDRTKLIADFEALTGCKIDWECPTS